MKDTNNFLETSETARVLKMSAATVRIWCAKGKLHPIRTSCGLRLFDPREVEKVRRESERDDA